MSTVFLSHVLRNDSPLYGGHSLISIDADKSMEKGDSCNTSMLYFPSHSGTHVDAPRHFIKNGKKIEEYKADEWIFNKPTCIEINIEAGELIQINDFPSNIDRRADIVLLKTGFEQYRNDNAYWQEAPGISPSIAEYILEKCPGLRAVGMDFISISSLKHREKGREAHRLFLGNKVLLFEDMSLAPIFTNTKIDRIIALPLRFSEGDGSPTTIIAFISNDIET